MGSGGAEITVGDLMKLIKGFVDMLILASGYQSSGLLACWDSFNIKKAFKWGLFLENMFRHLNSSHKYLDFMKELDAAVSEMRSHPSFPQGLTYLSSATLIRARVLLAEHMIHALPLRDEHLKEFFIAATEMDLDALWGKEYDYLNVYLDRVMSLRSSLTVVIDRSISTKDPTTISHQSVENVETGNCTFSDNTTLAVQELLKRQSAVSCLLTAEIGLDILTESISLSYLTNNDYSCRSEHLNHAAAVL
ncbi:hypothetical protein Nepgr_032745 [Nepenthes gracilis]|uniref:Uncharacterized protein n=1 Tax=Nepenthes gracilis TaxID=150966 RepID=A0AAD3TLF0_NEPGR|nr:hypothetical protein Nepgr_032745 [Nepenthes gracilis]